MMEPGQRHGAGARTIEEANTRHADERLPLSGLHNATEVVALTVAELVRGESA